MEHGASFSTEQARSIGEAIGIDWQTSSFDVEQFRMGLGVELEHGTHDPETNVSDDDELTTGKIARAHLNEFPDYYTRLGQMETEAERYWAEREAGGAE
jgi:DNA-directed RNA polymerase alpha subunit